MYLNSDQPAAVVAKRLALTSCACPAGSWNGIKTEFKPAGKSTSGPLTAVLFGILIGWVLGHIVAAAAHRRDDDK